MEVRKLELELEVLTKGLLHFILYGKQNIRKVLNVEY